MLGAMQTQTICTNCEGTGSKADKKCSVCRGATLVRKDQKIRFSIPAGIDESRSIRLSGKGEAGPHRGQRGDLYIRIRISSHPKFKRDGYNVLSSEIIPYGTLVAGGVSEIATPSGSVNLKIPAGTESGKVFILKDKGFERLSARGRGDQLVTIEARVPKNLTQEQKKLLDVFEKSLERKSQTKNWW